MPTKKDKTRQVTVEPDDHAEENSGGSNEEAGGELVPSQASHQGNAPPQPLVLPGFSEQQVNSMVGLFQTMLQTTLQQFFPPSNQNSSQPLPTIETSEQQASPPKTSLPRTNPGQLRAEEVGYFDPEYQQEQGTSNGPVVNAGKHVFYKDVSVFTDRLKDLAVQRGEADVKVAMTACFRGSALMWYSMELTELERTLLRDANLELWYTTLINRFKTRTSVALSQLVGQMYGLMTFSISLPEHLFNKCST